MCNVFIQNEELTGKSQHRWDRGNTSNQEKKTRNIILDLKIALLHGFVHNCIVIYTCLKISKFCSVLFCFYKSSCIAITFLFITPFYLFCLISLNCSSAEKPCDVILFVSTTFLSPLPPSLSFLKFLNVSL